MIFPHFLEDRCASFARATLCVSLRPVGKGANTLSKGPSQFHRAAAFSPSHGMMVCDLKNHQTRSDARIISCTPPTLHGKKSLVSWQARLIQPLLIPTREERLCCCRRDRTLDAGCMPAALKWCAGCAGLGRIRAGCDSGARPRHGHWSADHRPGRGVAAVTAQQTRSETATAPALDEAPAPAQGGGARPAPDEGPAPTHPATAQDNP